MVFAVKVFASALFSLSCVLIVMFVLIFDFYLDDLDGHPFLCTYTLMQYVRNLYFVRTYADKIKGRFSLIVKI